MSDITDEIATNALKPQSASADGVSATNRSADDLIRADQYLRSTNATSPTNIAATLRGMCLKIVPPGVNS